MKIFMSDITTKPDDPLPYTIVFAFLFITGLIVLTWTLSVWFKQFQCSIYPNIWCSDEWVCNRSCTGTNINVCFGLAGNTGLSSCLFGPNSQIAQTCINQPTTPTNEPACDCPTGMADAQNCFSNCARTLNKISTSSNCCCCPGQAGCPWTAQTVPSVCKFNGKCNS